MKKSVILTPSNNNSKDIILTLTENKSEKEVIVTTGGSPVLLTKSDFEKLIEELTYLLEEF